VEEGRAEGGCHCERGIASVRSFQRLLSDRMWRRTGDGE
jgi:hypothetical protein